MFGFTKYKEIFKKNIVVNFFSIILLTFGISNIYGASFYGGDKLQFNADITNNQRSPSIKTINNGNFVVAWKSNAKNETTYDIAGRIFDSSGNNISNEFLINTNAGNTNEDQSSYVITVLNNGNFVVVWHSYGQNGDYWDVYAQIFDSSGTKLGPEFLANTFATRSTSTPSYPSVAALNNDNFVVVWHSDQEGDNLGVYAQLFDSSVNKIGSEFLANSYTTHYQGWPSVAVFKNNNFIVTWTSALQDGFADGVYAQIFDQLGNKVGSEFQVNTYTANGQIGESVSILNNDNFVIAWMSDEQDGSGYGIYAQLFDSSGTKLGSEFRVNTYTSSDQSYPHIATLDDGNFVIVWNSNLQDGSGKGIYAQMFDASGTKLDSEFQVNIHITNDQWLPSIEVLKNGNFIIAWHSDNQDGFGYGIFGRIFKLNVVPTIDITFQNGTKML